MPEEKLSTQDLPVAQGAAVQVQVPASVLGLPATIAANATFTSNLILSDGFAKVSAYAKLTTAGTLSILRYLDDAGTILQTQTTATSLTANTQGVNNSVDGLPFASFQIQIVNSAGTTSTVTNAGCLMQSQ